MQIALFKKFSNSIKNFKILEQFKTSSLPPEATRGNMSAHILAKYAKKVNVLDNFVT